ncbi:MAG TPA: hypothetical protein VL984_07840 [Acidimicrobiales bacterium]|nr:hypothetical protein [Acidimicrobiales bacterium]
MKMNLPNRARGARGTGWSGGLGALGSLVHRAGIGATRGDRRGDERGDERGGKAGHELGDLDVVHGRGGANARPSHPGRLEGLPKRRAKAVACVLLLCGLGLGLPACSHTGLPGVGLPVGLKNCFEDLPLAEGALNAPKANYVFRGVKLVTPKVMAELVRRRFPKNPSASYKPPRSGSQVCAFAFTGDFPAGQVAEAPQDVSGKAAVVLTTTDRQLLFSFVLSKLPETFSRAFTHP